MASPLVRVSVRLSEGTICCSTDCLVTPSKRLGSNLCPGFQSGFACFHNVIKGPFIAPLILLQRPGTRQALRFLHAQLIAGKDGGPVRLPAAHAVEADVLPQGRVEHVLPGSFRDIDELLDGGQGLGL